MCGIVSTGFMKQNLSAPNRLIGLRETTHFLQVMIKEGLPEITFNPNIDQSEDNSMKFFAKKVGLSCLN